MSLWFVVYSLSLSVNHKQQTINHKPVKGMPFASIPQKHVMEKRVIGIVLTFLGIAGLIIGAINFMNGGAGTRNIKEIVIYFTLGAIFFFAGISLIRTTRDKPS
jgi:hypothetical protein